MEIQFWYGVSAVLMAEGIGLMIATAWLRKKVRRYGSH